MRSPEASSHNDDLQLLDPGALTYAQIQEGLTHGDFVENVAPASGRSEMNWGWLPSMPVHSMNKGILNRRRIIARIARRIGAR